MRKRCIHETLHVVFVRGEDVVLPFHEGLHAPALLHAAGEYGACAKDADPRVRVEVGHLIRESGGMADVVGIHTSDVVARCMGQS